MSPHHKETVVAECFNRLQETVHNAPGLIPGGETVQEELDRKIAEFKSLQRAMNNKLAAEVIRLTRNRNLTSLIHKLPNELLAKVLLESVDLFDWQLEEIKSIALVSTHWLDIVHTTRAFWPEISSRYPQSVIDIVLKRNPRGPLRVRCNDICNRTWRMENFLAVASQHAHRWDTLLFQGIIREEMEKYFRMPTPLLRDIFVKQYRYSVQRTVTISEGTPLHHLDLNRVIITWNVTRLSGLKTIQLQNLSHGLPSLYQLYTTLSLSPELEWLSLIDLQDQSYGLLAPEKWEPTINLPFLSTFHIQNIPDQLSQYLLSSIDAPGCRSFIAIGPRLGPLQPSPTSLQFSQTFSAAIRSCGRVQAIWDFVEEALTLRSEALPQVSDHWQKYLNKPVGFHFKFPWSPEKNPWDEAASFLSSISVCNVRMSVIVKPNQDIVWVRSKLPTAQRVYQHLVVPWRSATSLSIAEVRFLLNLRQPHLNDDGNLEWLCPQLRVLRIQTPPNMKPAVLARRIVAFAQHRYEGRDDGMAAIAGPEPLERLEVVSTVVSLIQGEEVFRNVDIVAL